MKKIIALSLLFISLSCSSYVRIDREGKKRNSELSGNPIVIMKQDGMILFRDGTGWYEQTFHKPTVRKYNVGDTLKL